MFNTGAVIIVYIIIIVLLAILLWPKKIRLCQEMDTCTMARMVGGFQKCREFWGMKCTTCYPEEFFK